MASDGDVVLQRLLLPVLKELKVNDYKVETEEASVKGDNYLGQIIALKLIFRTELNEDVKNLVFKSAPRDESTRVFAPIAKLYQREIYIYNTVLPAFEEFQRSRSVTKPFSSIVKCYNSTAEPGFEALLLQDLKAANFELWDRRILMDNPHVIAVLRELGRLHALSFAMRDQAPEDFKKLAGNLDNIFKETVAMMKTNESVSAQIKDVANMLRDRGYILQSEKFFGLSDQVDEVLFTNSGASVDEPYSVIAHGDSWCNNFMFKRKVNAFIIIVKVSVLGLV